MSDSPRAKFHGILRADFNAFNQRAFTLLTPRTRFVPNWHLEVIAAKLEAVRRGRIRRLIINVPPRSLKAHTASVAFVAWVFGHDPAAQILCVSYDQDLSDKFARDCRTLMSKRFYKALFPATRLSATKQAVAEFETSAGGFRLSVSVGGPITGRGADIIIIDDPLEPKDALSEIRRTAVNEWYDHTLTSRLNDKTTGAIILIMQRLPGDDLVSHVLGQEDWDVMSFPAIAEHDEDFVINTPYGEQRYHRRAGSLLQPVREPKDVLTTIRKRSEYNFQAQYQQNPMAMGEVEVLTDWFPRFDINHPPEFDRIIMSWDTAIKTKEVNDYSAYTTWGVKGADFYLIDAQRYRLEFPQLKIKVRVMAARAKASNVLIEDAPPSGTSLIQALRAEKMHAVTRCEPEGGDKKARLRAQIPVMENGFVFLPREAPWLEAYLSELTTFPKAPHDDWVDSTTQALAWLRGPGNEPSELTAIKREAAKQSTAETELRRFQVPEGTFPVSRVDGTRYDIDEDGSLICTEEEARGFRRQRWKELEL